MDRKRLGLIAIILCSAIRLVPTLYSIRIGMRCQTLIRASTRFASPIVIVLVAAVALIGPITLT